MALFQAILQMPSEVRPSSLKQETKHFQQEMRSIVVVWR